MEVFVEEFVTYFLIALLIIGIVIIYIRKQRKTTRIVEDKISTAKHDGVYEPVSLYPVIDPDKCIGSGACIKACPEHDILGLRNGRATIINAAQCIGHGACFKACPVEAISLWIGTEKRGVDLPQISPDFETNVKGIYIAGELGGMGLIRNAVTQGKEAVENIARSIKKNQNATYDLIVVGAGPAGISATLAAHEKKLKVLTLEQDSLGGTVFTYPRSKIVMTHPMNLPLFGKVRFRETDKGQLLELWQSVIKKYHLEIKERTKVEKIDYTDGIFYVGTSTGETFSTQTVLLAMGRRGTPRKLNIPGEESQKVSYRLLDSEQIKNKKIIVVGGGDSAVEAALMLCNENQVTLSYRKEQFSRLKVKNKSLIDSAMNVGMLQVIFMSELVSIENKTVHLKVTEQAEASILENDLVYIFAGGELPTEFLKKTGIQMNTKKGEAVLKH